MASSGFGFPVAGSGLARFIAKFRARLRAELAAHLLEKPVDLVDAGPGRGLAENSE